MPHYPTSVRAVPVRRSPPKPVRPVRTWSPVSIVRSFVMLLVLPAAIFSAVFLYTRYEHAQTAAPPPGHQGALVWSNGEVIFANTNEVAAWVRTHGGSFKSFKLKHPAAVKLVTRHRAPATHVKLAASETRAVTTTSSHTSFGVIALAALGGLLLLLALMPVRLLGRVGVGASLRVADLRLITFAAAAAIFAGLALALLL